MMRVAGYILGLLWCMELVGVHGTMHYVQQSLTVVYERSTAPSDGRLIDEQLYSRQLYVYGRHAQQRLSEGNVIVYYDHGQEQLAAEIVKNVALAGVGRLSVYCEGGRLGADVGAGIGAATGTGAGTGTGTGANIGDGTGKDIPLKLSSHAQLAAYAHELNPLVVTHTIETKAELYKMLSSPVRRPMESDSETVLVVADTSLATMVDLNNKVRDLSGGIIKFVSAKVASLCGLLFNDFSDIFHVADVEGADSNGGSGEGKEIPLKAVSSASPATRSPSTAITEAAASVRITCIDEESLNFVGLSDTLEISIDVSGAALITKTLRVKEVVNTKTVVLQADSPQDVEIMARAMEQGYLVTARKSKRTATVTHTHLERQLIRPSFSPCNGCLPDKRDRALSLALLAAFRALESGAAAGAVSATGDKRPLSLFRSSMVAKLLSMGVQDPLRPLREKGGEVGADTIDRVAERFLRGAGAGVRRKCPATVSVVGSLASQEAIKALTHIYSPVSQFLMFESLDSLMPEPDSQVVPSEVGSGSGPEIMLLPYGAALCQELARMKIFVVGSGAIGCELLKNFAMMQVGIGATRAGPRTRTAAAAAKVAKAGFSAGPSSLPLVAPQSQNVKARKPVRTRPSRPGSSLFPARGGIVLTDMDHIEKSNLNRQLLFRERHVGQPKSLVAAETVRAINPELRVRALTDKVGGTAGPFGDDFWADADLVVTALDNVDARRFVDEQCVRHCKPLLDSGTLGTKGNTQVVLPHVSESYASSADPPEEAIPLCTLKSFPYQPEHCVSWARAVHDELFVSDVGTLKALVAQALEIGLVSRNAVTARLVSTTRAARVGEDRTAARHIMSALEELPDDSHGRLVRALDALPLPGLPLNEVVVRSLRWALWLFDELFVRRVASLVQEHPANATDEEGQPFWAGSRRFPSSLPAGFNASDALHVDFVRWAAWLQAKTFGLRGDSEAKVRAFCSDDLLVRAQALNRAEALPASEPSAATLLQRMTALLPGLPTELVELWQAEEFEKDDLSLGHVALATSAANLRCRIYGLRGVGALEVQKVAGKIVPALATTTALVSGLVALELLKIASERVLQRRGKVREGGAGSKAGGKIGSKAGGKAGGKVEGKVDEIERERVLSRFRNSFVNVARPLMAFAQPVAAERFGATPRRPEGFSLWDRLELEEAGKGMDSATVIEVELLASRALGVACELQSLSLGDCLLFASFLPGAEEKRGCSLGELWSQAVARAEEVREHELDRDRGQENSKSVDQGLGTSWHELELVVVDLASGEDRRLPPLRLRPKSALKEGKRDGDCGAESSKNKNVDKGEDKNQNKEQEEGIEALHARHAQAQPPEAEVEAAAGSLATVKARLQARLQALRTRVPGRGLVGSVMASMGLGPGPKQGPEDGAGTGDRASN